MLNKTFSQTIDYFQTKISEPKHQTSDKIKNTKLLDNLKQLMNLVTCTSNLKVPSPKKCFIMLVLFRLLSS